MELMSGLDVLQSRDFDLLKNRRIGILCHQASVGNDLHHLTDYLIPKHHRGEISLTALFGAQHGFWGHTQDNMIEWEGYTDQRSGLKIYSLYGKHRKPTPEMLRDLEIMVIDLQDVGSRYYTFIWSMTLMMEACEMLHIPVVILDRPNPISGDYPEGCLLEKDFSSFVGLLPLVQRHAMTMGEMANYFKEEYFPELNLQVIAMQGWQRSDCFPRTGLEWVMPSPNMPSWETALVYPGMCLLEGTNLSEGRGTTRPFETFGAPWVDGDQLCRGLNQKKLPGVYFRPVQFQPTFQKYQGELCAGAFLHVTDRLVFRPVFTAVVLLHEILRMFPDHFRWKDPPYEYEYQKLPFDVLAGNQWLREMLTGQVPVKQIAERMNTECNLFQEIRRNYLLYK